MSAAARAARTALAFAVPAAVVVAVIAGVFAGPVAAVVVLVVVGAALFAWARLAGDWIVARSLAAAGVHDADRRSHARLYNLVEGLAPQAGVAPPRLCVLDSTAINAMVAGTSGRRAVLAVTSGVLAELDRIELEAVVAAELWTIRHDETLPATVLAATFGLGRRLALPANRDSEIDRGAVALTRYPPALAAALDKMDAKGSAVAGWPPRMDHLWLAPATPGPEVAGSGAAGSGVAGSGAAGAGAAGAGAVGPAAGRPPGAAAARPPGPATAGARQPGAAAARGRLALADRVGALREL